MLLKNKGTSKKDFMKNVMIAILVSIFCSFIGIILGININITKEMLLLIPVTIILAIINKRYTCLAYSTTILAIISIINKNILIDYKGLIGLVGLFHLMEGILILTIDKNNARDDVIYLKGELVKCKVIESTWVAPFSFLLINNTILMNNDIINFKMIRCLSNKIVFNLLVFTIVVIVGFGTFVVKNSVKKKLLISGTELIIYALTILFIYVSSKSLNYMKYIGLIVMPLMHELFIIKNITDEIT